MIKIKINKYHKINEAAGKPRKAAERYFDDIYRVWRSKKLPVMKTPQSLSRVHRAWLDYHLRDEENYVDELWKVYPDRFGYDNTEEYVLRRYKHNNLIYVFYYNHPEYYDKHKPYEIVYSENGVRYFMHDSNKMRMEVAPSRLLPINDITRMSFEEQEWETLQNWLADREKEREEYGDRGPNNLS